MHSTEDKTQVSGGTILIQKESKGFTESQTAEEREDGETGA